MKYVISVFILVSVVFSLNAAEFNGVPLGKSRDEYIEFFKSRDIDYLPVGGGMISCTQQFCDYTWSVEYENGGYEILYTLSGPKGDNLIRAFDNVNNYCLSSNWTRVKYSICGSKSLKDIDDSCSIATLIKSVSDDDLVTLSSQYEFGEMTLIKNKGYHKRYLVDITLTINNGSPFALDFTVKDRKFY